MLSSWYLLKFSSLLLLRERKAGTEKERGDLSTGTPAVYPIPFFFKKK